MYDVIENVTQTSRAITESVLFDSTRLLKNMSVSIEEAYARVQMKYDFPETLKEEQIECLNLLTHNKDLLCVLPTG